jgi:predicted ribosome quality control (RQC) complex YloA/Tae2 family protein
MDLLTLNAITQELQNTLVSAKITGIYQSANLLLTLFLRKHGKNHRVLISADSNYPCIYLEQGTADNQQGTLDEKRNFERSLKHHLQGCQVEDIHKPILERIVHINISRKELDGRKTFLRLTVEVMGRHSNIILIDVATGKILDSIKHVTASMTSYRRIAPGALYVPPPEQQKLDPLTLTKEEFFKILTSKPSEKPLHSYILDAFKGFSPLTAKEVQEDPNLEVIWNSFQRITSRLKSGPYEPLIITFQGQNTCWNGTKGSKSKPKSYLSPIRLTQFNPDQVQVQSFDSMSQATEIYYAETLTRRQLESLRSSLLQMISQRLAKNEKKQTQLEGEVTQAEKAEAYKKLGELITANLSVLKKGVAEAEVIDFYDPDQKRLKIQLDLRLTPSQNAQKYFNQYAKCKRSLPVVQKNLTSIIEATTYLKELQFFVEEATSLEELEDLKREFESTEVWKYGSRGVWGYESVRDLENGKKEGIGGKKQRKASSSSTHLHTYTPTHPRTHTPFRRFFSSDGFPIWVGRNSRENDLLTLKFATPEDLWLHAQGVPGSHVLILNRNRSESIPERTLEEAAAIAAYYSKGRGLGKVSVDYTPKKYVRKLKGSPPGLIALIKHKTILVKPRKEVMSDE